MAEAADIFGVALKNGSATPMARITGADAANIVQADIDSITYSIYLLTDNAPDTRTDVTGHTTVSLTVADVIFDALQTDARWTEDSTGYNFRHVIDRSSNEAFAIAGRNYLVEYLLTPTSGQVIIVRCQIEVK